MSPNAEEEGGRRPAQPRTAAQRAAVWPRDDAAKQQQEQQEQQQQQRPPVYNAEDYAQSLRTWGRRPGLPPPTPAPAAAAPAAPEDGRSLGRDYRNPNLTATSGGAEMSLKQFNGVSELLGKLKADLRLAFPSFVQEFVGDPLDGVTLLLELLRAVQLRQAAQPARCPPPLLRRALLDEHACLLCLQLCLRCADAGRRLAATPAGLFTLAVAIMSNVAKSRLVALELLTTACEPPGNGHGAVSDALSTLRMRFGEPVRFRFLVGMLTSTGGCAALQAAGVRFLNTFLETAPTQQTRMYIQAELEQAGFLVDALRQLLPTEPEAADRLLVELARWEANYVDVAALRTQSEDAEGKTDALQDKVALLERRVKALTEEKQSVEQRLKARCGQLESELRALRHPTAAAAAAAAAADAEDEGISSSDADADVEDDVYTNGRRDGLVGADQWRRDAGDVETSVDVDGDDDETTIDEVIEELRNIINDAETEEFARDAAERAHPPDFADARRSPPAKITIQARRQPVAGGGGGQGSEPGGGSRVVNFFKNLQGGINVRITSDASNRVGIASGAAAAGGGGGGGVEVVDAIQTELRIVPAQLLPRPPRRSRTVVQIVHGVAAPGPFFDDADVDVDDDDDDDGVTASLTSEEDSDSLLSGTRGRGGGAGAAADHAAMGFRYREVRAQPQVEAASAFDGLFYVTRPAATPAQSRFSSGRGSSGECSLHELSPTDVGVGVGVGVGRDVRTTTRGSQQSDAVVFRYGDFTSSRVAQNAEETAARRFPPEGSSHRQTGASPFPSKHAPSKPAPSKTAPSKTASYPAKNPPYPAKTQSFPANSPSLTVKSPSLQGGAPGGGGGGGGFALRRGHANAGRYSGQHNERDAPAQLPFPRPLMQRVMDTPSALY